MKFIDEATVQVKAGDGGPGAAHFRREKFVPFGGPDGGNGGSGGSIVLVADRNKHTLLDFQFRPTWEAQNGGAGGSARKDGKSGEDLVIAVPIGTQVLNPDTRELIADLSTDQQRYVLAAGGRGGKGNAFFKSATNRSPTHAQPGEAGKFGTFLLSLKLVADIGIVGFPNAGKSTFISRISAARPKIADYPFTTLTPNLGVVQLVGGRSLVVADIPGLIPGASAGKGLGIKFLKHVERTRVLLHLIDPLQLDDNGEPISIKQSFEIMRSELAAYSKEMLEKRFLVAISKADTNPEPKAVKEARDYFAKEKIECHLISSVTGQGIDNLVSRLGEICKPHEDSATNN